MDIFGPLEDKRTIWPFKNPLEEKEDKEDPVTWLITDLIKLKN